MSQHDLFYLSFLTIWIHRVELAHESAIYEGKICHQILPAIGFKSISVLLKLPDLANL